MKILIERCHLCGAPIYWDDETESREQSCSCLIDKGSCCAGGCCSGDCDCSEEHEC
jgi:hypothetical protein